MTTVENEVFIGLLHENFYLVERKLIFSGGGELFQVRGDYPLSTSRENPADIYIYI